MEQIISKIRDRAKEYFKEECPSHDWTHTERVYDLCMRIGKKEGADLEILKIASLLHDVGRKKEKEDPNKLDHAKISSEIASEILDEYKINNEKKFSIINCILKHRFRTGEEPNTIEARILFDADKLDSIGAIGIARAYAFVGSKGLKLYSNKNKLGTGYEKERSGLTEFKYKLQKVKDRIFTETAKKIAEERHNFMEYFFEQLNSEVNKKCQK